MKKLIACLVTLGLLIIAACSDNNPSDLVILSTSVSDGTAGTPFSQQLLATGGTIPYTWRIDSGALPVGLSLSNTGFISGTPTSAGTSTFTATVVDSGLPAQIRSRSFTMTVNQPGALAITSTSPLPGGTVSSAYSQTLAATGGTTPYSWAVTAGALPAGLSLNASTGLISGTPTTAGTANFTVTVTDSTAPTAATASTAFALTIAAAGTPVSITTTSPLPVAATGVAYSTPLVAANGVTPYTWAVTAGTLPAGLTLNTSTGVISGTPTTAGTSNFTVRVTDSTTPTAGTASTPFALTVSASGPAAPASALATGGTNSETITWNAVSGATSYRIYFSTSAGVTTSNGTQVTVPQPSTAVTSPYRHSRLTATPTWLSAGTTYHYIVTALIGAVEGPASTESSATTNAIDGVALYTNDCAGCHGALSSANRQHQNATLTQLNAGIANNSGGMGQFSTLTTAQRQAIVDVMPTGF